MSVNKISFKVYSLRSSLTVQGKQRAEKSQDTPGEAEPGKGWSGDFLYQVFSAYCNALVNETANTGDEVAKKQAKHNRNLEQSQAYKETQYMTYYSMNGLGEICYPYGKKNRSLLPTICKVNSKWIKYES